jgi:hypothetical protein
MIGAGVTARGQKSTAELRATADPQAAAGSLSGGSELRIVSETFHLTPSGKLRAPLSVTLPLERKVPVGDAVVVATSERPNGPIQYIPASLDNTRTSATFTTTHFSFFTALEVDTEEMFQVFKSDFLDALDEGATTDVSQPTCSGTAAAEDAGYSVASSSSDTLYWCLGMSGATPIVNVVNNRRYPLEIVDARFQVISPGKIDWSQLSSLSHFDSKNVTILAPGDEVGFGASPLVGQNAAATTQLDQLGQSLFALQTGLSAAVAFLTHFGLANSTTTVNAMGYLLSDSACIEAIRDANPGEILGSCFSTAALVAALGTVGYVLGPIMTFGSLIAFFHEEWNTLVDLFKHNDVYNLLLTRNAVEPTLGADWQGSGGGFGQVKPSLVSNGGDPTGVVSGITWQSWGGSEAMGTGMSDYVAPGQTVAGGTQENVTIVAFDLGQCDGSPAYTKVTWYFPGDGQSFQPSQYEDACNYFDTPSAALEGPTAGQWTASPLTISPQALGAVQIGMTLSAAEDAAGIPFDGSGDGFSYPTTLPTGFPHLYVGLGANGLVDCVGAEEQSSSVNVVTPQGFSLGGTTSQLKAVYGAQLQYVPAPTTGGMTDDAGYVVTQSSGNIVFTPDSTNTLITGIAAGPNLEPNSCTG